MGQNRKDMKSITIEFDSNENHRLYSLGVPTAMEYNYQ
jgi:hypothetical protein